MSPQLKEEFLDWLEKHNMVIQSPIANDTLLVRDPNNPSRKIRVNKLLLQIPVRELHNNLLSEDPNIGLKGAVDRNGNVLISDTGLRALLPPHLRMMTNQYKIVCGCQVYTQTANVHQSYNRYISRMVKKMEEDLESGPIRGRQRRINEAEYNDYCEKVLNDGKPRYPAVKDAL